MEDLKDQWAMQDSNLRPLACRARGLTPYPLGPSVSVEFDESNDAYHADTLYLNSSRVRDYLDGGPGYYHAKHVAKTHSATASSAVQHGTRVHQFLELGALEFFNRKVIVPDEFTTEAGAISTTKKAKEWVASNTGPDSILLTQAQLQQLLSQVEAIRRNPAAARLLDAVEWREFSVRWQHDLGHLLRARCDCATDQVWLDIKTTKDARPSRDWWKSVRTFGYGIQGAIYRWAARECGWPDDRIHYVVTSNVAPFECMVCTLPTDYVDACERRVLRALEEIEQRSLLDHWHDTTDVIELSMPRFTLEDDA